MPKPLSTVLGFELRRNWMPDCISEEDKEMKYHALTWNMRVICDSPGVPIPFLIALRLVVVGAVAEARWAMTASGVTL